MNIVLAAYQGTSLISRAIRFRERGDVSHVALVDLNTRARGEAWTSGVRIVNSLSDGYPAGVLVQLYRFTTATPEQLSGMMDFIRSQIGKRYDWPGVFDFVTRKLGEEPTTLADYVTVPKWFCSRLIVAAGIVNGVYLFRRGVPSYWVDPEICTASNELELIEVIKTGDEVTK